MTVLFASTILYNPPSLAFICYRDAHNMLSIRYFHYNRDIKMLSMLKRHAINVLRICHEPRPNATMCHKSALNLLSMRYSCAINPIPICYQHSINAHLATTTVAIRYFAYQNHCINDAPSICNQDAINEYAICVL